MEKLIRMFHEKRFFVEFIISVLINLKNNAGNQQQVHEEL